MTPVAAAPAIAIVLAGGRASRLGGVDKAAVEVDGAALVDHVFAAVPGCRTVAVGPFSLARPGVQVVREDPPFGGPVAALAAGLRALRTVPDPDAEAWVLACDLPRAAAAVARLSAAGPEIEDDGAVLVDPDGHPQWLAGRYRIASLRRALAALGHPSGASMRALTAGLRLREVPDPDGAALDLDTWPAIEQYRAGRTPPSGTTEEATMSELPPELMPWAAELAVRLGLTDSQDIPADLLLAVTRDVAHAVTRPAGPVTTYLIGLAVAGGLPAEEAAARVRRLLADRT